MDKEIELKLSLPSAEQQRFLRSPLLRHADARRTKRLLNIYYDTPDLALHCNGIALRLRQSGRRWLQTVKCAGSAQAGLSARPEWETPYAGHFDFSAVGDPITRKRLERLRQRLGPVFETDFRRTTWNIREDGTELLLSLDRGSVVANGRFEAISEVEIELAGGEISGIFALADRLAQLFPLAPCLLSKAERGYRLFLDTPQRPQRAAAARLDGTMSPRAAFRAIALGCLDHLQRNHHGAVHFDDAEYIHQMRVALRRLRAALRLFVKELPAGLAARLQPPLRDLMYALGTARDFDVLTTEIIAPVVSALPEEPRIAALAGFVAGRRHEARQQAVARLAAPEYGRLLLLAMSALQAPGEGEAGAGLAPFAAARMKRIRRKVLRLAAAARDGDPARLHALRIGAKRMRYTLEFFASLLPARAGARLIAHLAELQDKLGQINDLSSAGLLLSECAGDDPNLREAVSLIGGWHGRRHAQLLAGMPKAIDKLRGLELPPVR